jgi:phosphoserine phosphatase RsbU/P
VRVLVADDEPEVRQIVAEMVEMEGHEPVLAGDGGEAPFYLEAMAAGVDDFVTKPVSPDELHARLRVARRVLGLQDDVRLLEGLISICMYCKKVHVADGEARVGAASDWMTIERYVEERSDASFSHGICPGCFERHVKPDVDRLVGEARGRQQPEDPAGA